MTDARIAAPSSMTTTPATARAGPLVADRPRRPHPGGSGGPEGPWWQQRPHPRR